MKCLATLVALAVVAAANPVQRLQTRENPKEGATKVVVTDKRINFGDSSPWEMVKALGGPGGVCKANGACIGAPPPVEAKFMNDLETNTDLRKVTMIIDESEYLTVEERDLLIGTLSTAFDELTEGIDREYGPKDQIGDDPLSDGPSGSVLQNMGPEGLSVQLSAKPNERAFAFLTVRFEVVDVPNPNEAYCKQSTAALGGISAAVSGIIPVFALGAGFLGVLSACCDTICQ